MQGLEVVNAEVAQALRDEESRRWALAHAAHTLQDASGRIPASVSGEEIARRAMTFLGVIRPDFPSAPAVPSVDAGTPKVARLRPVNSSGGSESL